MDQPACDHRGDGVRSERQLKKRAAAPAFPADPDHLITGSGPADAEIILVGEAGGESEHHARRAFVGKAGGVLSSYLRAAGIPRGECFITNIYPFWTGPGNPDPTPQQIRDYEHLLLADIQRLKPRVIVAVGRVAAQWFLGDVDMETVHGIPHWSERAPESVIVPVYHPAAGFYDPDLAAYCQDDFLRVAYLLNNPTVTREVPKIRVILHAEPPEEISNAAVDTEGLEDSAWGMSWCPLDSDGKTAHVWIYNPKQRAPKLTGFILFHNALHDLKILRAMGISTRTFTYGDTMVRLFNLQLEPQALKSAVYRHVGLKMTEFDETVRPHFNKRAIAWLRAAVEFEYPKPDPVVVADYKKRRDRLYKPQAAQRRIKNLIATYDKEQASRAEGVIPAKPVRLEKRWSEIGDNDYDDLTDVYQAQAETRMESSFPDFSIFCVPKDEAVAYSGTDASATALLERRLQPLVHAKGLDDVYEMDRRALPFVDRMQEVGMRVDLVKLGEFEDELEGIRAKALRRVQRAVGDRWFNPGSSDQVARWLYSLKDLPVLTYTDSGRGSTSDSSLKMLRGYHSEDQDVREFLDGLQDYREADKYLGTFVRPVFGYVRRDRNGDWRIHPNFRVTRVVSGRLSSHEPNVLAFPARTKLGRKIRACFVARDGYLIVDCDLSQIELRTMAHHCRDARMLQAFERGEDLHSITCSSIFKIPLASVIKDSTERYVAKTINFAVMYGISARALLEQLYKADIFDYKLEDCERFIKEWFAIYGAVTRFLQQTWRKAERDGFVRDMWGRICYVPNVRLTDDRLREAARRLCGNFPIQSGAHGLVKRAEIRLLDCMQDDDELWNYCWPWLQMHDELVLETKESMVPEVKGLLEAVMVADQNRFSIPILAEAKIGRSWGEAKG